MSDPTPPATPSPAPEQLVASRTVAAAPAEVFALLTDPDRHQETEPTDWVRGAVEPGVPITSVGQVFSVHMFFERLGGDYVMDNLVTVLEPGRAIAWRPGEVDAAGNHDAGGWTWTYTLAPAPGGDTEVTLTYDWSDTSPEVRRQVGGMPPFPVAFLDSSLEALDRALS